MKKCLVCEKELKEESACPIDYSKKSIGIVYDGIICRSYGNYGSSIFDDFIGEYLEFYVCDACVALRKDLIFHVKEGSGNPFNPS